jgi:hypothetical protein
MKQELAESLVGKTVYTIEYADSLIKDHKVIGVIETPCHNGFQYTLKGEEGFSLFNAKVTKRLAADSLTSYWEQRVQTALTGLQQAETNIKLLMTGGE